MDLLKKLSFLLCTLFTFPLFSKTPLLHSINQFGYELYYFTNQPDENVVLSPFAICSNLYMVYAGSHGQAAESFADILMLSPPPSEISNAYHTLTSPLFLSQNASDKGYRFSLANGLWVDPSISVLNSYKKRMNEDFAADVTAVDFKKPEIAIRTINQWASTKTDDKLFPLLSRGDIDPSTRMMLTSATYIKGEWKHPFKTIHTYKGLFHPLMNPASPVRVDMMQQVHTFPYGEDDTFQYLLLPLEKSDTQVDLALLTLLPKKETLHSPFFYFYEHKHEVPLEEIVGDLKERTINLHLPKFTMKTHIDLSSPLKTMGLTAPFSRNADFSGITGRKNLQLGSVVHEALFSINEFGLLATAASASSLGLTATPSEKKPLSFIANRPFLYFLLDLNSKMVLFLGEMDNP